MHSTGSIIKTYIEKVRHYLDDPDVEAKYDDNYLVRFFLSSSMTDVISRVSMMSDNQILCRFTLQVTAGTERYKLPPVVRQVLRLGPLEDETKLYTEDFRPRNELSLFGPGWALEGNEIAFRPVPSENKEYVVLYVPSGDIACHYGTGTLNANGTFTMGAVPTIGSLDKRPGAYIGSYLRILGANVVDEVLISAHDTVTRVLSTRIAATNAAGTYTYEIVPFLMEPMVDAISLSAAMRAGVGRKVTQAQMQSMAFAYKQAIKTAYDTIGNMNSRAGKRFTGIIDTYGTISTAFPGGSSSGGGGGGTIPTCLPPCEPAEDDVSGTWPNLTVEALQGNPVSTDAPADGEVLTWDSTAGAWVPEPIPPQSGGEFRWYVSQSQGLDTNDGLTPATPFKTLAKVMTVAQPYDEILLKCGDRWREQINAPSMDNLTVSSYGAGEKPIIDGSDVITLGSGGWAETYDVTDAYYYVTGSISAAVSAYSYSSYPGKIHVGVYVDGIQLAQQDVSLQPPLSTNPGFYVATSGSPNYTPTGNVDFVWSDTVSLVGRLIEIAVRPYAIRLRDNCTVRGIRMMRNAHDDGSLVLGLNARVEDCECNDGSKHNCYVESGYLKRVRCSVANKRGVTGETGMGGATLFVAFKTDPSALKVVYDECSVYGAFSTDDGVFGWYCHGATSSTPYGQVVIRNCTCERVDYSIGGDFTKLLVSDSKFVNCKSLVFGGSELAGSKTVIVSSVLHTGAVTGDRVVQNKTRLLVMRGCEIIATYLDTRFMVDTEATVAMEYDLQNCTFVQGNRSGPASLGIIKTRTGQKLKMSYCALFQSDECPTDPDALVTPIVVVDDVSGSNHTTANNNNNLYHAGFKSLIRNNYYEGTPRRVRYNRGGTIFIGQDVPSGGAVANSSAVWIDEGTLGTSNMDGNGVNGPVLPYSTRLPHDTGTAPNVSFVGLADAQLPSHGEWISYPKSSWVALGSNPQLKVYGAWQWASQAEKVQLMMEFGERP
jgi:hypothetical protein